MNIYTKQLKEQENRKKNPSKIKNSKYYECLQLKTMRVVFLLSFVFLCFGAIRRLPIQPKTSQRSLSIPPYTTSRFSNYIDHFDPSRTLANYSQRILSSDEFYGKGLKSWGKKSSSSCKGPIFFYTGNESPVTDYWENSGFIFDLARVHGALVVFAEHRYFGESMPFGSESFSQENVGYLSPEQALADYAFYLETTNVDKCPVIAFGGSYGGMLTAWFRMKYPNVVLGGLSASAPFGFYGTGLTEYAYMDAAQESYAQVLFSKSVHALFSFLISLFLVRLLRNVIVNLLLLSKTWLKLPKLLLVFKCCLRSFLRVLLSLIPMMDSTWFNGFKTLSFTWLNSTTTNQAIMAFNFLHGLSTERVKI